MTTILELNLRLNHYLDDRNNLDFDWNFNDEKSFFEPLDGFTIHDDEITNFIQLCIHKICRSNNRLIKIFTQTYDTFNGNYYKYPTTNDKLKVVIELQLDNEINQYVDYYYIKYEVDTSSYQAELFSQFEEHVADDSDSDGELITIIYTDSDSEEEEEDQPLREL